RRPRDPSWHQVDAVGEVEVDVRRLRPLTSERQGRQADDDDEPGPPGGDPPRARPALRTLHDPSPPSTAAYRSAAAFGLTVDRPVPPRSAHLRRSRARSHRRPGPPAG